MGFNGNGSSAGLQSEINVTPLVDVVRVLLIIFMVIVRLPREGYDVKTPQTSTAPAAPTAEPAQIVLRVDPQTCGIVEPPRGRGLPADCRVSLDDREIAVADVPARVQELLGSRPKDQRVLFL